MRRMILLLVFFPLVYGQVTTNAVLPQPAAPVLPAANSRAVDPTFGTMILRVTDETDGTTCGNDYSYWSVFNADSTRILYTCTGGAGSARLAKFHATAFSVSNKQVTTLGGAAVADASWSATDPNILYTRTYGLQLREFNASLNTSTVIKDFSSLIAEGHTLWQIHVSRDSNRFSAATRTTGPTYVNDGFLVWERSTDTVLLYVDDLEGSKLDEVQISRDGTYLLAKLTHQEVRRHRIYNLQTGEYVTIYENAPHYATGHSDNGSAFVVGDDDWGGRWLWRSFASPFEVLTLLGGVEPIDWTQTGHASLISGDEWATISNYTHTLPRTDGFLHDEIFDVATDGSRRVRRWVHHQSVYLNYYDVPRAASSFDGKWIAFTSNWGNSGRRDVFIVARTRPTTQHARAAGRIVSRTLR